MACDTRTSITTFFSDGAKHLTLGESPYDRETYRYTPILAAMMTPNIYIWYPIGKFFLCSIDVLVGYLIEKLLQSQSKSGASGEHAMKSQTGKQGHLRADADEFGFETLFYLYNPWTVVICTRGSADCIITLLVLYSLILMESRQYCLSAFIYGFAVHFKIYPIIYAPALYLYLINKEYNTHPSELPQIKQENSISLLLKKMVHTIKIGVTNIYKIHSLCFIFISAFTFLFFWVLFYGFLGHKFLFEYLLYHVVRKDHRHNYSMFYYLIYWTYDSNWSKLLSMIAFLPQILWILLVTIFWYRKINLCLLILTMIFVAFNKVMTAQYFIWFFSLMPLIVRRNSLFNAKKIYGGVLLGVWVFLEVIWNRYSHDLEYGGENTFMEMWVVDIAFFLVNAWCIKELIMNNH